LIQVPVKEGTNSSQLSKFGPQPTFKSSHAEYFCYIH